MVLSCVIFLILVIYKLFSGISVSAVMSSNLICPEEVLSPKKFFCVMGTLFSILFLSLTLSSEPYTDR